MLKKLQPHQIIQYLLHAMVSYPQNESQNTQQIQIIEKIIKSSNLNKQNIIKLIQEKIHLVALNNNFKLASYFTTKYGFEFLQSDLLLNWINSNSEFFKSHINIIKESFCWYFINGIDLTEILEKINTIIQDDDLKNTLKDSIEQIESEMQIDWTTSIDFHYFKHVIIILKFTFNEDMNKPFYLAPFLENIKSYNTIKIMDSSRQKNIKDYPKLLLNEALLKSDFDFIQIIFNTFKTEYLWGHFKNMTPLDEFYIKGGTNFEKSVKWGILHFSRELIYYFLKNETLVEEDAFTFLSTSISSIPQTLTQQQIQFEIFVFINQKSRVNIQKMRDYIMNFIESIKILNPLFAEFLIVAFFLFQE